jgi:endonuclease YncB( thermonuclease family)
MLMHLRRALALLVATTGLVGLAQLPAAAYDKDCGDFATQSAAQTFFVSAGAGDPHRLDADGDGQACETLPCPCGVQQTQPQPFAGDTTSEVADDVVRRSAGNVVKVVDGDTLKVRVDGVGIRSVRLIGIDTPETYGRAECGGRKASRRMRELAPVGSRVVLVSDPSQADRDRYGRLLRYVERRGKDVGRAQVNLGQAHVYVYGGTPFRRTADYRRVQRDARDMSRGLWSGCWA